MKTIIHSALLLFVLAGFLRDVPSASTDIVTYSFSAPTSPSSMEVTTPIYVQLDCQGIHDHFVENAIPTSVIDADTGREIMGAEVVCEGVITNDFGQDAAKPEDTRIIPRAFGFIKVHYRP